MPNSNYGISYLGSKSKEIERFGFIFPNADHFYDLFGGGFAVTHFMIQRRSKDYKQFHFNEFRQGVCELIQNAIAGKFSYPEFKMPWVSREEFEKTKDTNAFNRIIWSFGNNGKEYLFGKDIEDYKKSLHQAVVFDEFDKTAKYFLGINRWPEGTSIYKKRIFLQHRARYLVMALQKGELKQLQQLQQLERLEQLQRLQQLQQLSFYNADYRQVPILPNSVIYCDIPYRGTRDYGNEFNHNEFYDWAAARPEPVFVSEYEINDTRFHLIMEWSTKSRLSSKGPTNSRERLYGNNAARKAVPGPETV